MSEQMQFEMGSAAVSAASIGVSPIDFANVLGRTPNTARETRALPFSTEARLAHEEKVNA